MIGKIKIPPSILAGKGKHLLFNVRHDLFKKTPWSSLQTDDLILVYKKKQKRSPLHGMLLIPVWTTAYRLPYKVELFLP